MISECSPKFAPDAPAACNFLPMSPVFTTVIISRNMPAALGMLRSRHMARERATSFFDFYLWQCTRRRLLHPELFLMSRWIRPEDLHIYEGLGLRNSRSSIVPGHGLALARRPSLCRTTLEGNLLDILSLELLGDPGGFHGSLDEQVRERMRHYEKEERGLMLRMLKLRRRLLAMDLVIDNAELTDFLSGFRKIRCAETYCEDCRYCHRYAERAVRFDRGEAETLARDIGELMEDAMSTATHPE